MRVAIDTSPLEKSSPHHIRGSGFYLRHLLDALKNIDDISLFEFVNKSKIPDGLDLVHFPYFEPFFLTLPFKKKYKMIVTVHDLTPLIFPNQFPVGIRGRVKWELQKALLQRVNGVITDSESSKKDIIRIVGISAERVYVVPLAAADHFKHVTFSKKNEEIIRQKYALPEKFVLYVGDVTANKNLPRLIRAVQKLDIPLFLAGKALTTRDFDTHNPWNKDLVEVQKILEGEENIKAIGFVPDDDLVALYNFATVFAMPSLYEGFGLPVLEALQCGTPVVTTKAGSLYEVAGDAAVYVDPYSESSIASGIQSLYNDAAMRRRYREKGEKQASQFSWHKTAALTYQAYQAAIQLHEA
jgi:glycosyltransferase involved in cell wall biosynthesis